MNRIVISNREPQQISIGGGGQVIGVTEVLVNGVDVTVGSVAYVVVPTKTSELQNDSGYITQETDPTIPYYIKQITQTDINNWNNKQNQLISGVNIKTINENSILGSGNLDIDTSYTAGNGIEITEENVINNTITSYNDLTDLPTIPTSTSELLNDSDFVSSTQLNNVAFSGNYDDLTNKPIIPTQTSQLENNSGFITNRVDDLLYYYTKDYLYNLLPKVSDSGTNISLDNTYKSDLNIVLSPSESSQDSTPTPSDPQVIHTINGDNTILVNTKNLFDDETAENILISSTGTISSNVNWRTCGYVRVNPSSAITMGTQQLTSGYFQLKICEYDKNKNFIQRIDGDNVLTKTITTSANCYYVRTAYRSDLQQKPQLELGSSATDFVAYNGTDYSVNLGNIEYCKVGSYSDRIFKNVEGDPDYDEENLEVGLWYIKKNIGKVVLDGSENWSMLDSTIPFRVALSDIMLPSSNSVVPSILANRYKVVAWNTLSSVGDYCISVTSNEYYLRVRNNDITTLADFKADLGTNNLILYYVLNTPTYTQITGTLEDELQLLSSAQSKDGQTNISQINEDLPFVISATSLKDLSSL